MNKVVNFQAYLSHFGSILNQVKYEDEDERPKEAEHKRVEGEGGLLRENVVPPVVVVVVVQDHGGGPLNRAALPAVGSVGRNADSS